MSVDRRLSVGYYADESHCTKVHIHVTGWGPACGARVKGSYQWCSWDNLGYVECESCKRTRVGRTLAKRDRTQAELNIILDR